MYGMRERNSRHAHARHVEEDSVMSRSSNGSRGSSSSSSSLSILFGDKDKPVMNGHHCPPRYRRWFLLWLRNKPSNSTLAQSLLIVLAIYQLLVFMTQSLENENGYRLLRDDRPTKYSPKPLAVAITGETVERIQLSHKVRLHDWDMLYSSESSDDGLEHREECEPMYDWQTEFHPTCNNLHELSFTGVRDDKARVVDNGMHRDVWEVVENDKSWALKTLRANTDFDKWHEQGQITDAIISEQLTFSPYVADIYSFCGFSALYDFASEGTLQDVYTELTREERMRAAAHASRALAHVHAVGDGDKSAIVHADIAVRQFVKLDGIFKLNDFNTAGLLQWNTETNSRCGHKMGKPYDKNRAPEEMFEEENWVDEMIDVYSLGNIFYKLLMNERKYEHMHTPEAQELIMKGDIPRLPDDMEESKDRVVVALKRAMHMCLILEPEKRATAQQVAGYLERELKKMEKEIDEDEPTRMLRTKSKGTRKR